MWQGFPTTASNLTIRKCEFDGTGVPSSAFNSMINYRGVGTCLVELNWFHNSAGHIMEQSTPTEGGNLCTLIFRNNLEEEIGIDPTGSGPGVHVNFTQMLAGTTAASSSVNSQIVGNTMIQHLQPAKGQITQVSGSNALVDKNTMICKDTGPAGSGTSSISNMIDCGSAGTYFQGTVSNNYIDRTGCKASEGYGPFYPTAGNPLVHLVASGNISLLTGKTINVDNSET